LEARAQSINRRAQADNIAITASKEAEWTEGNLLSSSTMFKFTEIARRLTTHESLKVVDEAYSNEAIKEKDLRQDYRQHFVTTAGHPYAVLLSDPLHAHRCPSFKQHSRSNRSGLNEKLQPVCTCKEDP